MFKRKAHSSPTPSLAPIFVVKSNMIYRIAYFTPLIGFLLAWPAMPLIASPIDWQIYIFSLLFVAIFSLNAGNRPLLRIEELHITFFHTMTGRINFCYINDIRYIELHKNHFVIHTRMGDSLYSPYLTQRNIKDVLTELAPHHIFTIEHASLKK
ncbi:hypothetical protein [Entomospira culicis]|uniref:PH domain-containing protein n=1 Tax=Entomospira culicis TaxID=2719989 RepID=A0A968GGJ8_9SPIO|nr:hypothetical protein [Entomospira culicis]NIZ19422.1 hypothetical protein [Entomospira culicis]NIZ69673.1 hypothetical protein [Entomospira culicis]WDI36783.1 hypothetical protein PVA46_05515 [Entomospira culicis]WDI38412.1 hypothetical protein PVA47_05525 [Entomospira culicis]